MDGRLVLNSSLGTFFQALGGKATSRGVELTLAPPIGWSLVLNLACSETLKLHWDLITFFFFFFGGFSYVAQRTQVKCYYVNNNNNNNRKE